MTVPFASRSSLRSRWAACRARPRPCPQTIREEVAWNTLAWANGLFSLLFPGGYVVGWRYAGLVLPQQGYGLVTTLFAAYATYGLVNGSLRHRMRACALGIAIAGVTGFFVGLANPFNTLIPIFVVIVVRRWLMIGDMGDAAGAAAAPRPPR